MRERGAKEMKSGSVQGEERNGRETKRVNGESEKRWRNKRVEAAMS